jgi:hypothetical protein
LLSSQSGADVSRRSASCSEPTGPFAPPLTSLPTTALSTPILSTVAPTDPSINAISTLISLEVAGGAEEEEVGALFSRTMAAQRRTSAHPPLPPESARIWEETTSAGMHRSQRRVLSFPLSVGCGVDHEVQHERELGLRLLCHSSSPRWCPPILPVGPSSPRSMSSSLPPAPDLRHQRLIHTRCQS